MTVKGTRFAILLSLILAASINSWASTRLDLKKDPAFPLRGPAPSRPAGEHDAHATFSCWADGVKSMDVSRAGGRLQSVRLHVSDPRCAPGGLDLTFERDPNAPAGGLTVLALVSPAVGATPLSAYRGAELVLSVAERVQPFAVMEEATFVPIYSFRLIFKHDRDYDPTTYGQFVSSYRTVEGWQRTEHVLLDHHTVDKGPSCDSGRTHEICSYDVWRYRQTFRNTLTGEIFSTEYERTLP